MKRLFKGFFLDVVFIVLVITLTAPPGGHSLRRGHRGRRNGCDANVSIISMLLVCFSPEKG